LSNHESNFSLAFFRELFRHSKQPDLKLKANNRIWIWKRSKSAHPTAVRTNLHSCLQKGWRRKRSRSSPAASVLNVWSFKESYQYRKAKEVWAWSSCRLERLVRLLVWTVSYEKFLLFGLDELRVVKL